MKSSFAPECTHKLAAIGWEPQPVNGSMTPCIPYYRKRLSQVGLPSETFVPRMDHRDTFRKRIRSTRRQECHVPMVVQPLSCACSVNEARSFVRSAKRDGNLPFHSLSRTETFAKIKYQYNDGKPEVESNTTCEKLNYEKGSI